MDYGVIYTLIRTLYHQSAPPMDPLLNNGPQGHLPIQVFKNVFMRNLKEQVLQLKRYYIYHITYGLGTWSSETFNQHLYLQTHQDKQFEDMVHDGVENRDNVEVQAEESEPSPTLTASIICKHNAATIQKTDTQYNLVRKKLNVIKIDDCNSPGLFVCKYQITFRK